MFTGIIEETGHIRSIRRGVRSFTLAVDATEIMPDVKVGDSIATDGVCLTVTSITPDGFTADVMPETVNRTALSRLQAGSEVNLERALTLNGRLGGHIVSGHVDGTGFISAIRRDDNAVWLTVNCDGRLLRYIAEKGSITIQGVSLTVAQVFPDGFSVSLIPHTQKMTTLHSAREGDIVNLETDVIAKYTERLLGIDADRNESLTEKLKRL